MSNRFFRITLAFLALTTLTACEAMWTRLENSGSDPKLAEVEVPMKKEGYRPLKWPEAEEQPKIDGRQNVGSLWQPGGRSFFKDATARRVGDILKIIVMIDDKAALDNATDRKRESENTAGASSLFGLENLMVGWLPGKATPSALVNTSSSSTHKGEGTTEREEKIETQIAAIVTQILPNGNLVIEGDQEVSVNNEIRKITVTGMVRPEDIAADNSIDSNLIAEARIGYGGRGQLTDAQSPRVGHQIIDAISPF
ncbi:MAG: flgH [Rickettsiales bacterium]|jgi:flagellar L-ring protein precursor FlgH|nr:flgH [Rickettsiales bacterium]